MRWATGVGTGLAELVWSVRDGLYSPRLKPWHPQFLHWRWDLHDAAGGWQLITQTASVEPVPGAGKWLLVQPGGARRPWMAGGVRALAIPYLMRGYAYRDWANYSEVHGGGIKKALVPSEAPEADKQLFFQSIQTLGAHGLVVLPVSLDGKPAFDLQMLEATSSGWEGFEKLIARTDDSIAISELGQNLTTQVDGGSRAAASVHDKVRGDVMEADSLTMCGAIREQVLRPWARYNFGDPDLAPIPSYDATPPVDQQKVAATWKAVADALHAFQAAKIPVNAQALLDQAGVPTAKGPISQEQN
jgi:phage gp29-like protein